MYLGVPFTLLLCFGIHRDVGKPRDAKKMERVDYHRNESCEVYENRSKYNERLPSEACEIR